jgi:hypothetical protein
MSETLSRRRWIERSLLLSAGAAFSHLANPIARALSHATSKGAGATTPRPVTTALSLSVLQRTAQKTSRDGKALPDEIAAIGGLNVIRGFVVDDGGDTLLLGNRNPQAPRVHIDDLMVAIRSAYTADAPYDKPPGCSIDPMDDASDPWAIQAVRVLGMPRCRMARRHVALDYELKRFGSGIAALEGVRDSFAVRQGQRPLCEGGSTDDEVTVTNRFWFCARYPDAPRYSSDEAVVLIERPVEVQVLTERRLPGSTEAETPSSPDDDAEQFAHGVTERLLAGDRREYLELRNDFRIIEVGRLLRFREVPPDGFAYLLADHQYEPVDVPQFVVGIRRSQDATVVCGGTVTVAEGMIRGESHGWSQRLAYRGGVDAGVETPPSQFKLEPAGRFAALREQVLLSRPSPDTLTWSIRT